MCVLYTISMQDNKMFFKDWLYRRKISDSIISEFNVHWGSNPILGECIVIPVNDVDGNFSFNKYRRNPLQQTTPKYLYDKGAKTALYGADRIQNSKTVLITEGEMDCLVAWSHNIPAVSGTGGAMTFLPEWIDILKDKEIVICFDNDEAGGAGMVRVLQSLPQAKVLFIPDRPNIKDISDYVTNGGDLQELLRTAIHFGSVQDVIDNRSERLALWKSVCFHDAYLKEHIKPTYVAQPRSNKGDGEIQRAKSYPIDQLIDFKKNKACCPFHNEKTPSLHYYRENNSVYCFGCAKYGDAIDVYRQLHNCSFKQAIKALQ